MSTPITAPGAGATPGDVEAEVAAALQAIAQAQTVAELALVKAAHVGERSPLALANQGIGALPPQERKPAGLLIGQARSQVAAAFAAREALIGAADLERQLAGEAVDVTLPIDQHPLGAMHPVTQMMAKMSDVFVAMGWEVAEGPEAEAEWLNFDALNFTPDHPARFLTDTLFLAPADGAKLLRTHTSPVQMRALLSRDLPLYIVSPGKAYRADEVDATHLPVFHQLEGLAIDKGLGMADLRGCLDHLAASLFGDQTVTRLRPHYFPFTEPSAEVDVQCFVCHGASIGDPSKPCRTCRSEGWIEWGGCGVVNPRVLQTAGIDPDIWSGFAFGMGIERTVMFGTGAPDIRDFVEGDMRFARQFEGVLR